MMAERLAEIRRDLDSEAYTSYLPKTVRELLDHIDGLKFANGVLDDAAKDAQAWSVRAQTAEAKCAQLEAQRGGAVVVPTKMDDDDWEAIGFQQSTEGQLQRVWDRAVSRIQPIPADRVLGEGMVGVDRKVLTDLREGLQNILDEIPNGEDQGEGYTDPVEIQCWKIREAKSALDALHAQQAKGE